MKRLSAAALLSAAWLAAHAATDIRMIAAPAGFTREAAGDHVAFTRTDPRANTFCQIAVYAPRAAKEPLAREFRKDWQELAVQRSTADFPRTEDGALSDGSRWIAGEQQISGSGMKFLSRLYTIASSSEIVSLLVNSSHEAALKDCRPAVDRLLAALSQGAGPQPGKAVQSPAAGGAGIAGVWMSFKADFPRSSEPKPAWLVLFADGTALRTLPNGGLLGLDRAATRAKLPASFGTYSYANGAGRVRLDGVDAKYDIKLAAGSKGQLLADNVAHQRCVDVDGLRLSGAWTSYADPADPALERLPAGQRPILRFARDGRFVDEGIFATFLHGSGGPAGDQAGAGSYALKDFTLTLRYDDGRVRNVGFTGFMGVDPRQDDKMLYIERSLFRRRP